MLRSAQSPRSNVVLGKAHGARSRGQGACPERKPKDRFLARLASEICLSSLRKQFLRNLLDCVTTMRTREQHSHPSSSISALIGHLSLDFNGGRYGDGSSVP